MELAKFVKLVIEGEKYNVDFKIRCEAFHPNISVMTHKAELAKDICAMSNNGNIASYIIVGVSDDGQKAESVTNPNLTDDYIQNFCKDSIIPPPKVRVSRKRWLRAESPFANVDFVIIQIGPQRRQAFRLSRDFIDYREKICLRHNEVWIRRGATTDIATPDEIARLVKGEPPIEDEDELRKKEEREAFLRGSRNARLAAINQMSESILLRDLQYKKSDGKGKQSAGWYERERTPTTFYKWFDTFVMILHLYQCRETLTQGDLESYAMWRFEPGFYKSDIPQPILRRISGKVLSIRRLSILPVLSSVPLKRVQTVLTSWDWSGNYLHFFMPFYRGDLPTGTPDSSAEFLVIDNIKSINEYQDGFISAIKEIEKYTHTIITSGS